ncbi:DUF3313 family protein [Prosthecobacter vanneervenii]|uniref:Lipoprotein n=1 Tax=Prosthecobacter vanneervenii TaxID=48466 RepID=A0A7W7YCN6_9BACT|nr:hypothetical protein [Prosthecobacter vanneervenii]
MSADLCRLCKGTMMLLALALASCRTAKSVVAAVEVKPSTFLEHAGNLREVRERSPFLGNWWDPDKKMVATLEKVKKIYIAPVQHSHVRPMEGIIPKIEYGSWRRDRNLPTLAKYTRKKFIQVFKDSKNPRFTVVDEPGKEAVTLELSLLEWVPNTYTGFAVREVVDWVTFDGVAAVTLKGTRGVIAIEGRMIEPKSGKSFFEFADKEIGKTVLILPIQEFFPSGQAHFAITEWAKQLEELLRTKADVKVKDSFPVVLWNY